MTRWNDITSRQETTTHRRAGGMRSHRGVVIHTASGFYDGTISWQKKNIDEMHRLGEDPTSSHFVISKQGEIAQMMDLEDLAWAQAVGNPDWISVECAGFGGVHGETLTDAQLTAVARILVKAHQVYGVPLQVANDASGHGLGHHSMGGVGWGHQFCPGPPIVNQKAAIVVRAVAILSPPPPPKPTGVDDVSWTENLSNGKVDYSASAWLTGANEAAWKAADAAASANAKIDALTAKLDAFIAANTPKK